MLLQSAEYLSAAFIGEFGRTADDAWVLKLHGANMASETNRPSVKVVSDDALATLDTLDKKVAELRAAIKKGQPLTLGKTNLLSGLLQSLKNSMGSW